MVGVSHDDMKKGVRGLGGWKVRRLGGYGFMGLWVYGFMGLWVYGFIIELKICFFTAKK